MKETHEAEVLKSIIALVPLLLRVCKGDVQEEHEVLLCLWHLWAWGNCMSSKHGHAQFAVPERMLSGIDAGEQAGVSSCMVMCQSGLSPTSLLIFLINLRVNKDWWDSCYNVLTVVGTRYSFSQCTPLNWSFLSFTGAQHSAEWCSRTPGRGMLLLAPVSDSQQQVVANTVGARNRCFGGLIGTAQHGLSCSGHIHSGWWGAGFPPVTASRADDPTLVQSH